MNIYNKLKEQFKKENSIIRTVKNKDNPYVMINKLGIQDPNLSWAAKGLLAYLLSLPDDWKFNVKGLCLLCKESKLAVTNALKELEENRYLIIEKGHSKDGKFLYNYIVYEKQYTQKVHTEQPYMDN